MNTRKKAYKRPDNYVPKHYSETDLAYFAGIIDGEGCFWIGEIKHSPKDGYKSPHYRGVLKIDNTDIELIQWLERTFEGTNSARTRSTSSRNFERTVYSWVATGDHLLNLCELVLPYLVIKKKHCLNMIKFRATYKNILGSNKITDHILATRLECVEISKKLNSRWHLHPLKHK